MLDKYLSFKAIFTLLAKSFRGECSILLVRNYIFLSFDNSLLAIVALNNFYGGYVYVGIQILIMP